jgi:sugar lactone lactonase YvrE
MRRKYLLILILSFVFSGCGERIKLPTNIPRSSAGTSDTTYVPLTPVWTQAGGISFDGPQDVHVGFDGHIYIADTGNDRVVKLDQAGNYVAQYEGTKQPNSVSQDRLFRLVATGGNRIYLKPEDEERFDSLYAGADIYDSVMVVRPDTIIDTVIVPPDSMVIDTITGLFDTTYIVDTVATSYKAIAPDPRPLQGYGLYFVCDSTRNRIDQFILLESGELYRLGAAIPSGFDLSTTRGPTGLFTYLWRDKFRFLFCQSLYYYSVQLLDGDSFAPIIPQTDSSNIYWQGTIGLAEDVAADEFENIFVVDRQENEVHKFSRNGVLILSFGQEGTGEKEFRSPKGIAYANKIVYVADTGNNRILRFVLSTDLPH